MSSPLPFPLTHLSHRLSHQYDTTFHFYLAKSINQLLRKKSYSPQVILFNDLLFLDQQDQFLKRYYRRDQSPGRIQLLSNYFLKCRLLPEEMPCLVSQSARKYMFKRVKRYGKCKRRQQETEKEMDGQFPELYEQYLFSMRTEDMVNQSESVEVKNNISYQSSVYDIFGDFEDQKQREMGKVQKRMFSIEVNQEEEDGEMEEPKNLVWDFSQVKKGKTQPKMYLDLNRLPSHYELAGSSKSRQSFSKHNISSLSPEEKMSDMMGFYTGRYKQNRQSERLREMDLRKERFGSDPYVSSERDFIQIMDGNFKVKGTKDKLKTETIQKSRSENKEHEEYMKLLEKIGKKFKSPDSKKQVDNNYIKKTSKFKPKDEKGLRLGSAEKIGGGLGSIERLKQATSINQNRLETLRYKAMRLIEDPRSMRDVKSSDPTVRHK